MLAFEAALKESAELQEKFAAAKKRIAENKEAEGEVKIFVKAATEVGFDLTVADVERAIAEAQELSDEDLENVSGGFIEGWCFFEYFCFIAFLGYPPEEDVKETPSGAHGNW